MTSHAKAQRWRSAGSATPWPRARAALPACPSLSHTRVTTTTATATATPPLGVSGVFEAEDGATTDPIEMSELVQGTLLHSDASGAPLSQKQGGPLRVTLGP